MTFSRHDGGDEYAKEMDILTPSKAMHILEGNTFGDEELVRVSSSYIRLPIFISFGVNISIVVSAKSFLAQKFFLTLIYPLKFRFR